MAKFKSHIFLPLFFCLLTLGASAQTADTPAQNTRNESHIQLDHLDLGVNLGTTGLGINVSAPVIKDFLSVRAGFNYIPRTHVPLTFKLMSYAGTDDEEDQDAKFDKMSELMKQFTGFDVDKKVKTNANGTMYDFKLLFDIYPLRNKHFYTTVGFHWGSNKVGHVENDIKEAPSLLGVMMYNRMHDYFENYTYLDEPFYGNLSIEPEIGGMLRDKFMRYGRVGAHMGNFADGTPYLMEPDENGMVQADMYVNRFKPYLGVGYKTTLSKDGRWHLNVDLGGLYWGKPKILTHERYINTADGSLQWGSVTKDDDPADFGDRVNVANDVDGISGRVGKYVRLARAFHVLPALSVTISYTIF